MRADFQVTESLTPDDAVRAADAEASGLVVLSDTGDSVFGGAGRRQHRPHRRRCCGSGSQGRALVPLVDAAAVARLAAAGERRHRHARRWAAAISGFYRPIEVTGVVRRSGRAT